MIKPCLVLAHGGLKQLSYPTLLVVPDVYALDVYMGAEPTGGVRHSLRAGEPQGPKTRSPPMLVLVLTGSRLATRGTQHQGLQ